MQRSVRPTIAMFMTAIYLLVVLAPLAPTVLHSPALAHALTGECSGDCRICGCAPERSAARACCCWQQKLARQNRVPVIAGSCCRKAPAPPAAAGSGCCGTKAPPPAVTVANCCSNGRNASLVANDEHPQPGEPETTISATPCGSAKNLALAASEKIQHMPFVFSSRPPCPQPLAGSPPLTDRLTSQPVEPPDPPPKISARS